MNAITQQPETAVLIDLDDLQDSPYQKPRVSDRGNLEELAASMRDVGVLEPLLVRRVRVYTSPRAGDYEVVAGHRRKRAAALAGLTAVPCLVRDYSDDQVLEIQCVENGQREGVHPLDEADVFAELVKRGRSVGDVADKVGRSHAYVAQRLKLQDLSPACRKALDEERLTLGAALALARVPGKLQDEALQDALDLVGYGDDSAATVSAKAVRELIEDQFMLLLERAPFPIDDAELVKKAGPCTTCPKRTGNQPALFSDVKSKDLCTDPVCYKAKAKAYWPIRAKAAEEAGQAVLESEPAKKALSYGSGYKKLDDKEYLKSGKSVEVRTLAKKANLPITVAQDPETGAAVELVRAADLQKVAGVEKPERFNEAAQMSESKAKAKERIHRRVLELALGQAVEAAEKSTDLSALEAVIIHGFCMRAWNDTQKAVLARRDIEMKKGKGNTSGVEGTLLHAFDGMTAAQRRGLGVELALHMMAPHRYWGGKSPEWAKALKVFGVKLEKIEAQAQREEKERAAKKRERKAKATKKTKAKP